MSVSEAAGGHDPSARKAAKRAAREKGCRVYIPADVLRAAGFDPDGPPPFYRTWAGPRGGVLVQLYRSRSAP